VSAFDLPPELKGFLAGRGMREHHALWHYVRAKWPSIPRDRQEELRGLNWDPPQLRGDTLSGVDFLGMHREMIREVVDFVGDAGIDADISGWRDIPWDPADPVWPMPAAYPGMPEPQWKQPQAAVIFAEEAKQRFCSDAWLRTVSVDYLGRQIERGIHDWMHIHWSDAPWFTWDSGKDVNDPKNDWLASPYSSHVNKHFWKIHGWIDDRISQWERAKNKSAETELAGAWLGPSHPHMHDHPVMTDEEIRALDASFGFSINFFAHLL
jgi:hypothetical protein